MHELSLAEGIRQLIDEAAHREGFTRVRQITLEIGALAAVEVEALRFALDTVLHGSLAEGAQVQVCQIPGQAWCLQCSRRVPLSALYEPCPLCGGHQLQVISGRDLRLKDLLVE